LKAVARNLSGQPELISIGGDANLIVRGAVTSSTTIGLGEAATDTAGAIAPTPSAAAATEQSFAFAVMAIPPCVPALFFLLRAAADPGRTTASVTCGRAVLLRAGGAVAQVSWSSVA
jgi:hypothetical protein